MSQQQNTATTIKIAAKEASKRVSGGGADPGPGDLSAAPSVAPELVDIPEPPTSSQLVVKSTASRQTATNLPTLNEGRSGTLPSTKGPKSIIQASLNAAAHASGGGGGGGGGKSVSVSGGAAREPTSSRQLTGVPDSSYGSGGPSAGAGPKSVAGAGAAKSVSGGPPKSGAAGAGAGGVGGAPKSGASVGGSGPKSGTSVGGGGGGGSGPKSGTSVGGSGPKSGTSGGGGPASAGGASPRSAGSAGPQSASSPATASTAMQADSGVVHDEDEEGEGELEHPEGEVSPGGAGPSSPGGAQAAVSQKSASGGGAAATAKSASSHHGGGLSSSSSLLNDMKSGPNGSVAKGGKKNKVTKFRYHKRIVVRTKGNANPSSIMDKVNKRDGNTRITPSTIEDMDPQELMKRAGIKGTNKTHWRVRLRQTKRLTKNGKTTTQTKVAYRDSEGNKRVKTSSSPFCKNCGKKLEECKCESNSES